VRHYVSLVETMKTKHDVGLPIDWLESTPEWKAAFGLISGEEYLRLTAHYQPESMHTESYKAKRAALTDRNRKTRAEQAQD
jgi:hypothetical protein